MTAFDVRCRRRRRARKRLAGRGATLVGLAILACVANGRFAAAAPPVVDVTQADFAERDPGGPPEATPRFIQDVVPALTKAGCNAGACHGSFQGRGGLALSLLGFDPAADYDTLVKAARGRRVRPTAPRQSLLITKPTGIVPHGGGRRCDEDSPVVRILTAWIAGGAPGPRPDEPIGPRLSVTPTTLRLAPGRSESLRVVATWPDGRTADVTAWALYDSREPAAGDVSAVGTVVARAPGRTSLTVRYCGQVAAVPLTVPLGPPADDPNFRPANFLDELAVVEWRQSGVKPAPTASDAEFCRRVHLDLIGTLPTPDEVQAFLADPAADKRERLVDRLLDRPEYVDYWTLRWSDLLRAHRRFLGDKGLATFQGWLREQIRDDRPVDQMVRELLTAQGNLFSSGPVAFYFLDEKIEDLTENASQSLLGVRLQCMRCHHHPQEVWGQEDYYGLASFFTRLETKDSGLQGARFGGPKSIRPIRQPHPGRTLAKPAEPRLFGEPIDVGPYEADVRRALADWMVRPSNPFFARNFANRYWAAMFGRGLVEPVDDLRGTNPPVMPTIFDALADRFVRDGYRAKATLRTIARSQLYQRASELDPAPDRDARLFTHRTPARLPAEVLLDAVNQAAGTVEKFDGQPAGARAIALPDPTIPSYFLTTFGRPARNSPCDCARSSAPDLAQALHLANGTALHRKAADPAGRAARLAASKASDEACVAELYLATVSRRPTAEEQAEALRWLAAAPSRAVGLEDLLWTLLNTAEFSHQH